MLVISDGNVEVDCDLDDEDGGSRNKDQIWAFGPKLSVLTNLVIVISSPFIFGLVVFTEKLGMVQTPFGTKVPSVTRFLYDCFPDTIVTATDVQIPVDHCSYRSI